MPFLAVLILIALNYRFILSYKCVAKQILGKNQGIELNTGHLEYEKNATFDAYFCPNSGCSTVIHITVHDLFLPSFCMSLPHSVY